MERNPVFRLSRAIGVGGSAALLAVFPSAAQTQVAPVAARVSAIDAARLYGNACSPCHGRRGDGRGPGASLLRAPQPRDFTAGVFKFRSTPTGSLPTDADLYRTIGRGVPGTWMPAWENLLTSDQRWALVRYVKTFSEVFVEEDPDAAIPIPEQPDVTLEMILEGRFVYLMLGCSQCHGLKGRGDGPSADELTDDWDEKIQPYDFTRGHYKNGAAPPDLYRTLVTGLSGSPMPAFESDIVAYPGGRDADTKAAEEGLDPTILGELRAYLVAEPTSLELEALPDAGFERLVQQRLWALVSYVRSLDRGRGIFYWLLRDNPEVEIEREGR